MQCGQPRQLPQENSLFLSVVWTTKFLPVRVDLPGKSQSLPTNFSGSPSKCSSSSGGVSSTDSSSSSNSCDFFNSTFETLFAAPWDLGHDPIAQRQFKRNCSEIVRTLEKCPKCSRYSLNLEFGILLPSIHSVGASVHV